MNLKSEIGKIEKAGADLIHIDVMDGNFVPNITFGPGLVKSVKKITKLPLDVHLMIANPEKYIKDFAGAGSDIITVHIEAVKDIKEVVNHIKQTGAKAGVSLNPKTPLSMIEGALNDVDMVLVMSVNPGFSGQKFIESSVEKIKQLKEIYERTDLSNL